MSTMLLQQYVVPSCFCCWWEIIFVAVYKFDGENKSYLLYPCVLLLVLFLPLSLKNVYSQKNTVVSLPFNICTDSYVHLFCSMRIIWTQWKTEVWERWDSLIPHDVHAKWNSRWDGDMTWHIAWREWKTIEIPWIIRMGVLVHLKKNKQTQSNNNKKQPNNL